MKEIELEVVGAADNLLLGGCRQAPWAAERPVNEVWHARIYSLKGVRGTDRDIQILTFL